MKKMTIAKLMMKVARQAKAQLVAAESVNVVQRAMFATTS